MNLLRVKGFSLWIMCLFSMQALVACGQRTFEEMANEMAGKTTLVQMSTVKDQLDSVIVLDAREYAEYAVSHLPGARFIGYDSFDVKQLADIPKDSPIVVYCSVGYRSGNVVEKMQKAGYSNVANLWGGIFHWVNMGNAVENESGPTNKIHPYSNKWGKWLTSGEKSYE
jgi:rhodanese-related sulfurtransferase